MRQIIDQKLKSLEAAHGIKILFACESGSRAWGFFSPDSDYDVRFIYVHKTEYYLSIDDQRDVLELPINDLLDINGWDLRKTLRLFRKSNAPLYEWLQSPVIYSADEKFVSELRSLMYGYFSPRAAMHHYLSMAKGVFENDLSGNDVRLKKYFYALRPVLACRWIAGRAEVPPMEFGKLRILLDDKLGSVADELLEQKSRADEKFTVTPIRILNDYISEQITLCEKIVPEAAKRTPDNERLNQLFRKYIL